MNYVTVVIFLSSVMRINVSLFEHETMFEKHSLDIYRSIKCSELDYNIFKKGLKGYYYLKSKSKLENENVLSIIDYSKPLKAKRFFVIDLKVKKALFVEEVGHASGSGKEFAKLFSNDLNSEKSSLGFFVTGRPYWGEAGYSLKLMGQEEGFNTNAFARGVVLHSDNDKEQLISSGCFVICKKVCSQVIETLKEGSCLFVYFPYKEYLSNSIYRKFIPAMLN